MLSFENDYLEGAHEKVLNRLVETNRVQAAGYGFDHFTEQAIQQIKIESIVLKQLFDFLSVGHKQIKLSLIQY